MALDEESEDGRIREPSRAIPESLLQATEQIWSATPPSEITMRRIADEAGVSLGVAYNYFDSKEALFGAMLERVAERLSVQARSGATSRDTLLSLWDAMEANPAFHRLMTWLVLEGQNVSLIMHRHPVIADLTSASETRGVTDPGLAGGMAALMGISLQTFEVLVNRAMGRDGNDPALRAEVVEMFESWFDQ